MSEYSTDNMQLAAFLLTRKQQFIRSEPIIGQESRCIVRFYFKSENEMIDSHVDDFWNDGATTVGAYNLAMKRMKSEIRRHFGIPRGNTIVVKHKEQGYGNTGHTDRS